MDIIRRWRNDWRIWRWCRQNDLISDVEQQDWFRKQSADAKIRMYAICSKGKDAEGKEQDLIVGVAGFTDIDWLSRTAEFSLYIAPDCQGGGLGKAALQVLVQHGVDNLNLRWIYGEVLTGNPALAAFEEAGFFRTGHKPGRYFKDGAYLDGIGIALKAAAHD